MDVSASPAMTCPRSAAVSGESRPSSAVDVTGRRRMPANHRTYGGQPSYEPEPGVSRHSRRIDSGREAVDDEGGRDEQEAGTGELPAGQVEGADAVGSAHRW